MISDNETNYLYLADSLPKKHPKFFNEFESILTECNISHALLPNTKDIWAVDYMPIQIETDKFVQFTYNPDYLQSKKWLKTISDVDSICKAIDLNPVKSNIIIDGGNVIRSTDKVIMCSKVFKENPQISEKQVIKELENLLQVDKIIFIPSHPADFTGHADGMVRFLDSSTVLINDYSREKPDFKYAFRLALHNAGLDYIEIPHNPYDNQSNSQANGVYINFLQMENVVIVPTFSLNEDEQTVKLFEKLFNGYTIKTIDSNEVANNGGILNCITWNIRK